MVKKPTKKELNKLQKKLFKLMDKYDKINHDITMTTDRMYDEISELLSFAEDILNG